jgi:hypothetical protein
MMPDRTTRTSSFGAVSTIRHLQAVRLHVSDVTNIMVTGSMVVVVKLSWSTCTVHADGEAQQGIMQQGMQ